jgi:hypothetical protein
MHLCLALLVYCLSLSNSLSTTIFASKNRSTHCFIHGSSYLSSLPFLTLPAGMHLRKQVSVRECIAIKHCVSFALSRFACVEERGWENGGMVGWERTALNSSLLSLVHDELLQFLLVAVG